MLNHLHQQPTAIGSKAAELPLNRQTSSSWGLKTVSKQEWVHRFSLQKGWNRVALFSTSPPKLIAANFDIPETQIRDLVSAYEDRDTAIAAAVCLQSDRFEVHRWQPPFIYGRRGLPNESEGIAMIRGKNVSSGNSTILLVTYKLPFLSPEIVPQMVNFFKTNVGEVPYWELPEAYRRVIQTS